MVGDAYAIRPRCKIPKCDGIVVMDVEGEVAKQASGRSRDDHPCNDVNTKRSEVWLFRRRVGEGGSCLRV